MNRIVISGYYGFGNAGDEAMLAAILEALFEAIPDAEVTVISGSPKQTAQKHGVKAVGRLDIGKIVRAISRCDLLISGGGSLLQDVTSDRSLYYYLTVIRMALFWHKPVMLYAQGIGPLRKETARRMVGKVLNRVNLITVRDQRSKDELRSLGVTVPPIEVTADAVLGMHPVDVKIGWRLLSKYKVGGINPKIGISVRSWKQFTSYRAELAKTLDALQEREKAQIVFIPMQHPDDTNEAKAIQALMRTPSISLEESYTTTELLALTGCMDLVIGVRLHALVFASLMGRPVVGISYDPKIANFLHMIGQEPVGSVNELNGQTLLAEAQKRLHDQGILRATQNHVQALREVALHNAHLALTLLRKDTK